MSTEVLLRHHTLTASSVFLPTNFDVASLGTRHDLCNDALELADGMRGTRRPAAG